jgi:ferric-dicitrate binding protein FerR (iron transport regulator)
MNESRLSLPSDVVEEAKKWLVRQLESDAAAADPILMDLAIKAHAAHEHYLTANLTSMKQMWPNMHKSNEATRELIAYVASKPTPKDF